MKTASPTALLAIPLATAFAGAAAPTAHAQSITYDLTVNPTLPLLQSYLFAANTSSIVDIASFGAFGGGTENQITYTDDSFFAEDNAVVFLGVYNDAGNTGLSVSLLEQGFPNVSNPEFTDLFAGIYPNNFATQQGFGADVNTAEAEVIADLLDPGAITTSGAASFFAQGFAFPRFTGPNFNIPTDDPFTGFAQGQTADVQLGNFSTLSDGGTISINRIGVVPEPTSLALLGVGGMLLVARRRR